LILTEAPPQTTLGRLQRSPVTLVGFQGPTSKGNGEGGRRFRRGKGRRGRKLEGKERRGSRSLFPRYLDGKGRESREEGEGSEKEGREEPTQPMEKIAPGASAPYWV